MTSILQKHLHNHFDALQNCWIIVRSSMSGVYLEVTLNLIWPRWKRVLFLIVLIILIFNQSILKIKHFDWRLNYRNLCQLLNFLRFSKRNLHLKLAYSFNRSKILFGLLIKVFRINGFHDFEVLLLSLLILWHLRFKLSYFDHKFLKVNCQLDLFHM